VITDTLSDTDIHTRDAVTRQLDWDPQVDASAVGVAVKDGIATLTGYIDSYPGKLAAERAAKRVHGVRAVANEIEVRLKIGRTDTDIARDAVRALELHSMIPKAVQAVVRNGQVTLTGTVSWLFQKQTAEHAVHHVRGVKQVLNNLVVAPQAAVHDVRQRIMTALHQDADVDARHLAVTLSGNTATLTGTVATWLQRESAERAAADAPGIVKVDNRIVVEPVQPSMFDSSDEMC
jgi:osmotically-inducible protein OsmY